MIIHNKKQAVIQDYDHAENYSTEKLNKT